MTPVFVPPTKVLTFFYIGYYSLMVIQNGYGEVEGLHLTELVEIKEEEI
jgi:hypothetical protein